MSVQGLTARVRAWVWPQRLVGLGLKLGLGLE